MKTITFALPALLVSSFVLAGCSGPLATIQSKIPFLGKSADAPQSAVGQALEAGKMSAMIATGKSGVCTITNRETGEATELFIKGKKMKFSGTSFGGPEEETLMYPQPTRVKTVSYFLNDGEYTYVWEQNAKTGFKTKLPTEEEIKKMNEALPPTDSVDSMSVEESTPDITQFESDDAYTINCDMKDVPDKELAPPTDVEFMDFSQMSEDWAKSMPTGDEGNTMPGSSGMELPEGFDGQIPADQ
jgi:hypothetical protein